MELKDKIIVVTGGASGIGREMCRRFAREGAKKVIVADLNGEGAAAVAAEFGGHSMAVDVRNESEIIELINSTETQFGPIDLFCSNAEIKELETASIVESPITYRVLLVSLKPNEQN